MDHIDRSASERERARLRPERERLCRLLRVLRAEAGLDQLDVARHLGRHQSFVSRYETGERKLDLVELGLVTKALGATLADLIRRFEGKRAPHRRS